MFAITGATGHLGQATINALLQSSTPADIVAIVRDPKKTTTLRQQGVQVRQGDYENITSLVAAFGGVTTVLLISTNELDDAIRTRQHRHVIDAARQAGVHHLVYTSVLNPSRESQFSGSASHLATEEYLRASGLTYTIFRNTLYMDLIPGFIGADALSSGKIYSTAGTGQVSYALREDIAQALAIVLMAITNHENQTYDIAPAPTYSMRDVTVMLSEVSNQPVEFIAISADEMASGMRQQHIPEAVVGLMVGITGAMQANELSTTSNTLEQLLGRKPADLKTYLTATYTQ